MLRLCKSVRCQFISGGAIDRHHVLLAFSLHSTVPFSVGGNAQEGERGEGECGWGGEWGGGRGSVGGEGRGKGECGRGGEWGGGPGDTSSVSVFDVWFYSLLSFHVVAIPMYTVCLLLFVLR